MRNNIILGAGISGITSEKILKCKVIEQADHIGGLCSTVSEEGFKFDYTGHYLHISKEYERIVKKIIQKNTMKINKKAGIAINNRLIDFPFQTNFHFAGDAIRDACMEGYLNRRKQMNVDSFKDWILKHYGEGIAKYFMLPYNEKLWQCNLDEMTVEWLGKFIPEFTDEEIKTGNFSSHSYNDVFYYPKRGGFEYLLPNINSVNLSLNETVMKIDVKDRVVFTDKYKYKYSSLISTIPLKELMIILNGKEEHLKYSSVYNINLGIKGKAPVDFHWLYFPEKDVPFYRVGFPSNVNRKMAPKDFYSLSLEIGYNIEKNINFEIVLNSLKRYGLIKRDNDIVFKKDIDIKYGYVIYDKQRREVVNKYIDDLEKNGIFCTGRYGKWHYSFVAQDIIDASELAENIQKRFG